MEEAEVILAQAAEQQVCGWGPSRPHRSPSASSSQFWGSVEAVFILQSEPMYSFLSATNAPAAPLATSGL